jgi:hypothetical protein
MVPLIWPDQHGRPLPSGVIARGLVLGGLLLGGCATPGPVTMRNPQTNEITNCAASYRQFLDGSFRSQEHRGLPAEGVRADLPPERPEIDPIWR